MLSRHDDFPIHQTPEPLAHPATGDRNFYDRYWFNGFARDGEFLFGIALALYPNRGVLDAALSLVRDGEQHCFRASRRLPRERSETRVGPLALEVLEPMRRLSLRLAPNQTGIEADLRFAARTAPAEEARTSVRRDERLLMDTTRFTQFGHWEGWIRAGGRLTRVSADRVPGVRDRSWGVRPLGEPEPGAPASPPQVFFLWAPLHWEDVCTHFGVFETPEGRKWHSDGMILPAYDSPDGIPGGEDPGLERLAALEHRIAFERGTRWARSAELLLTRPGGESWTIELTPLLRFHMIGIGYGHPEWGHGRWKGEEALAGESWKLSEVDPRAPHFQHVQQLVRARRGQREGVGVLEQICFGPHARYGFEAFLDPAA